MLAERARIAFGVSCGQYLKMCIDAPSFQPLNLTAFGASCDWPLERLAAVAPGSTDGEALAAALAMHGFIIFSPLASDPAPQLWREAYIAVAQCMGLSISAEHEPQKPRSAGPDENLRGASFPCQPSGETQILGKHDAVDWHGLRGSVWPTPWHEACGIEWHHDGAFGAGAPPPPPLVLMYTNVAATGGGSVLRWPKPTGSSGGEEGLVLPYEGGATLFRCMRAPLARCAPGLATRARRMICVYRRGFGLFKAGAYPVMRASGVTSGVPPPSSTEGEEAGDATKAGATYRPLFLDGTDGAKPAVRYALVQTDARGGEHLFVCGANLEALEEDGALLPWADATAFLEELLTPGRTPEHIHAHSWCDRQFLLWDNRTVAHSVTPYEANGEDPGYASVPGCRRLCCHTRMTTSWEPLARPPGARSAS